jgi:F0F1-type ATP synthase assembly protein I
MNQRDPRSGRDPRGEGKYKVDTSVGTYVGAAWQFAGAIVLFLLVGQWLDKRFGTSWLTIVGVFVGASAGFYSLYRKLMAEQRRDEERRRAEREERGGGEEGR